MNIELSPGTTQAWEALGFWRSKKQLREDRGPIQQLQLSQGITHVYLEIGILYSHVLSLALKVFKRYWLAG